jgi:hypothetical protein
LNRAPGIAARPNQARLIGVAGANVPHALQRLAGEIAQLESLVCEMPGLAAVFARMNVRAEPRAFLLSFVRHTNAPFSVPSQTVS